MAIACFLAASDAQADGFYQYTDSSGSVRIVGDISEVPPAFRALARPLRNSRPINYQRDSSTVSPERAARAEERARELARTTPRRSSVVLYSANWCGYCKRAKAHLEQRGVAFEVRDIDDPRFKKELIAKTGSSKIPVIEVGGRRVTGWDPNAIDRLIR